jgi:hypothetical protein
MMAFFYYMKKYLIIFALFSVSHCYYSYNSDDWFFVLKPGEIKSITSDSFSVYFLSNNGIYSYDYLDNHFLYNKGLSQNLDFSNYKYLHYHSAIDYFYLFSEEAIFYKTSLGSVWKEISLNKFKINSIYSISDIGFSNENIILKTLDKQNILIDLFTLDIVKSKNPLINNIKWLNINNSIDISNYYTLDNSLIYSNYINDESNIIHSVSSHFLDKDANLWIGMNTGVIYKVDDYSYQIEKMNIGPQINHVSGIYKDEGSIWYFYDKYYKRTGNYNMIENTGYFVSIWNENSNTWKHISRNEHHFLRNAIINNVNSQGDLIFFQCLNGIIIYNQAEDLWFHKYIFLSGSDKSIWDIDFYNKNIFFASSNGFAIADYILVNNEPKFFNYEVLLNGVEVYDIESVNDKIYFSTNNGLYQYSIDNQLFNKIDENVYLQIEVKDSMIFGSNENLWKINLDGRKLISKNVKIFSISGNNICASDYLDVKIINYNKKDNWFLNLSRINLNESIYSIDCDKNWLWFTGKNGLTFFNWVKYDY